jgi:GrpB-like predicted nucleotidyltransferase (UPF0157 family)
VSIISRYRVVAEQRGLEPWELPLEERIELALEVVRETWPGFAVTAGSERRDGITISEYDPAWPSRFEVWRDRIATALGPAAIRIEHVGSTAVPGLAAKPIVDIQVSVADLFDEARYVTQLEAIGVQLRSRDDLHRFFRPFAGRPRDVHVHVCGYGLQWERDHLLFRDYLRASAGARQRYAAAKREAVRLWSDDGWAYTDAKNDIVRELLEEADGPTQR